MTLYMQLHLVIQCRCKVRDCDTVQVHVVTFSDTV